MEIKGRERALIGERERCSGLSRPAMLQAVGIIFSCNCKADFEQPSWFIFALLSTPVSQIMAFHWIQRMENRETACAKLPLGQITHEQPRPVVPCVLVLVLVLVFSLRAVLRPRWLSKFPLYSSSVFLRECGSVSVIPEREMPWEAEKARKCYL